MRIIDADALKERIVGSLKSCEGDLSAATIFDDIDEAPTIDAKPVIRGQWKNTFVLDDECNPYPRVKCDQCNGLNVWESDYCPNCGADMREVEQ